MAKTGDGKRIDLYRECYALVIGVSDYLSGWPDLPNAAGDADAVGNLLSQLEFKVTKVKDPHKYELIQALEQIVYGPGQNPDNCVVIFFAGHGYTQKLAYGADMGYIVPRDAPLPDRDNAGFMQRSIDMETMEAYARRIQAKHVLFLFDSCFSGAIFDMTRAVPAAISYKTERPVRQFITAGGADEPVPDRSIFKSQLIEALKGEADRNNDGYVTGTELGEFLQEKVVNYSRSTQHPQYGKIRDPNLDKGDFVFVLETISSPTAKYGLKIDCRQKNARVFVNGGDRGVTPFKQKFVKGRYMIKIEKAGYKTIEESIEIESDVEISYDLIKLQPGRLHIKASPYANIIMYGKLIGEVPPVKVLEVEEGKYTIEFASPKLDKRLSVIVEVKAGETKEIRVNMRTGKSQINKLHSKQ